MTATPPLLPSMAEKPIMPLFPPRPPVDSRDTRTIYNGLKALPQDLIHLVRSYIDVDIENLAITKPQEFRKRFLLITVKTDINNQMALSRFAPLDDASFKYEEIADFIGSALFMSSLLGNDDITRVYRRQISYLVNFDFICKTPEEEFSRRIIGSCFLYSSCQFEKACAEALKMLGMTSGMTHTSGSYTIDLAKEFDRIIPLRYKRRRTMHET